MTDTLTTLSKEQLDEAYKAALANVAHLDSPEGYSAFYELIHGFPPPGHIMTDVRAIFKAHAQGIGCLIFNYRGAWKSVSISVTFLSWRIGLEPHKTNIVVGANDDSAEKITKAVAQIIEFNPNWKLTFGNVVPDTGRWSVEGFSVIDQNMSREEWAQKQSGIIDPTIVGGGYTSSRLIGKHPSGMLILDDVHDLKNSSSKTERREVVQIITKVLLKTVLVEKDKMTTWLAAVGTPWALDDAYYEMKKTGLYEFISIPVMKRAKDGSGFYIDGKNRDGTIFEDIVGWWELTHPDRYGVNSIIKARAEGKSAFWQMWMLDLVSASSGSLRHYPYPAKDIKNDWPVQGGVDPTNVDRPAGESSRRSSFALAYIAKLPTGGAVVVDGVLQPCSTAAAINHIYSAQAMFPAWINAACENVGGGSVFIQAARLVNPHVRIVDSDLGDILKRGGRVKSKPDRINLELSQWFENGRIRISDADTPFLNALRRLFDNFFDLTGDIHDEAWDAGDAVYHAVKAMPDILQMPAAGGGLPSVRKTKQVSILEGIGDYRGYG